MSLLVAGNLQNATVFSTVAVAVVGSSDIVEIRQINDSSRQYYDVLVNKLPVESSPQSTSQFRSKCSCYIYVHIMEVNTNGFT